VSALAIRAFVWGYVIAALFLALAAAVGPAIGVVLEPLWLIGDFGASIFAEGTWQHIAIAFVINGFAYALVIISATNLFRRVAHRRA
jgi:hypothetical protein